MKFWLPMMDEPTDQFCDIAKMAERYGFEGICLADHVAVPVGFESVHPSGENPFTDTYLFPDPFSMIVAMSMVTSRLRFMSYVYVLPLRDPFTVAKQVGTTAILSNYRVVFGVGVGWLVEEFGVLGQDPKSRGRRTDEMLEVIRDFWDDGYAEHHGEFFDVPRSGMFPVPEQAIPVWVGGKSPAALRRAVSCDGWLGMNYGLDEVYRLLDELAAMRQEMGDRREDFETLVIPNAAPSLDLYRDLQARGVTATLGAAWRPGDREFRSLDAKQAALESFAEHFVVPLAD
ncbi:MAG TPA: TIGR03619 family F420-dependent LLM class oxidoreductase [Acidimicrobiales bacterium]|nr:TIGR03619 family F420-dependent LLM class oxidoreductase [Acidimicrobiales bacterium]